MVLESVRPPVPASQPFQEYPAPDPAVRPVIDAQTIKTILYLGMKGDLALGGGRAGASPAMAPSAEHGVDTYA
jgi:hypothetical protein